MNIFLGFFIKEFSLKYGSKWSINLETSLNIPIEKCPELTDFIMKSKIKSVRKTALILCIIACGIAFVGGLFCGMNWTRTSIPNNIVQIEVSGAEKPATNELKK